MSIQNNTIFFKPCGVKLLTKDVNYDLLSLSFNKRSFFQVNFLINAAFENAGSHEIFTNREGGPTIFLLLPGGDQKFNRVFHPVSATPPRELKNDNSLKSYFKLSKCLPRAHRELFLHRLTYFQLLLRKSPGQCPYSPEHAHRF